MSGCEDRARFDADIGQLLHIYVGMCQYYFGCCMVVTLGEVQSNWTETQYEIQGHG